MPSGVCNLVRLTALTPVYWRLGKLSFSVSHILLHENDGGAYRGQREKANSLIGGTLPRLPLHDKPYPVFFFYNLDIRARSLNLYSHCGIGTFIVLSQDAGKVFSKAETFLDLAEVPNFQSFHHLNFPFHFFRQD